MGKYKLQHLLVAVALVLSGGLGGFFVGRLGKQGNLSAQGPQEQRYSLLNPVIGAGIDKHFIINFKPLRDQLEAVIARYPHKAYVYFDYLNNATWVGVNERELFAAASTIKVPLAMAVLKAVEQGQLKLSDRYGLEGADLNNKFGQLYRNGTNQELSISELLEVMLRQSDNTATNALYEVLHRLSIEEPLQDVYSSMGWEYSAFGNELAYRDIYVKVLSNMFISLYNAKYVNEEHSQLILDHLSHTPFKNKLVAGVPQGVTVAHKIGITGTPTSTFSDCGIVYVPSRHYVLCLGSKDVTEPEASKFMAEVSQAVYDFVVSH